MATMRFDFLGEEVLDNLEVLSRRLEVLESVGDEVGDGGSVSMRGSISSSRVGRLLVRELPLMPAAPSS